MKVISSYEDRNDITVEVLKNPNGDYHITYGDIEVQVGDCDMVIRWLSNAMHNISCIVAKLENQQK